MSLTLKLFSLLHSLIPCLLIFTVCAYNKVPLYFIHYSARQLDCLHQHQIVLPTTMPNHLLQPSFIPSY